MEIGYFQLLCRERRYGSGFEVTLVTLIHVALTGELYPSVLRSVYQQPSFTSSLFPAGSRAIYHNVRPIKTLMALLVLNCNWRFSATVPRPYCFYYCKRVSSYCRLFVLQPTSVCVYSVCGPCCTGEGKQIGGKRE